MKDRDPSSFKDPDGYVFYNEGQVYRHVNYTYKEDYESLKNSGLYDELINRNLLLPHEEIDGSDISEDDYFRVLRPVNLNFISYPYEWSFSQLKDAALLTLEIQETSLDYGMTLKDASPFNIQFKDSGPILIDTLSFELESSRPWKAYEQFCKLFLIPLCLMSYRSLDLKHILKLKNSKTYTKAARSLMPLKTYLKPSILLHVHMVSKISQRNAAESMSYDKLKMSRLMKKRLVRHLKNVVEDIDRPCDESEDFLQEDSGSAKIKKKLLSKKLSDEKCQINQVWAIVDNVEIFKYLVDYKGIQLVALDRHSENVEYMYNQLEAGDRVVPIHQNLRSPSPGLGWKNREMRPLLNRGSPDLGIVFSQLKELVLENGIPLEEISGLLSNMFETLIIEFDQTDETRGSERDNCDYKNTPKYEKDKFESSMEEEYDIVRKRDIENSESAIYVLEK
jgi:hypothetical protein